MVQLRVKTELQEDYSVSEDYQLPKAVPLQASSEWPGQCICPVFITAIDGNGNFNVLYNTACAESNGGNIINIYRDSETLEWRKESTGLHAAFDNSQGVLPQDLPAKEQKYNIMIEIVAA
jgi:hypothetical protein